MLSKQDSQDRIPRESEKNGTGRKGSYITEYSGHNRQDVADSTAQTGDKRQVRTTRFRKTGSGNLNHTIGTWFCQRQRVSLCKIKYFILKHIPTGTAHAYFKVRAILDKKN